MGALNHYIVPVLICSILFYGLVKGVPVFDLFLEGARDGLMVAVKIVPALVALMTAVSMFRASGALDVLSYALRPVAYIMGLPPEVMPLAILRPISGSGGLILFKDLLTQHGPDSFIGRVASVMEGSTETTFYTIAVYYGAVGISKSRHTLPAALTADIAGFVMSSLTVIWFFGR